MSTWLWQIRCQCFELPDPVARGKTRTSSTTLDWWMYRILGLDDGYTHAQYEWISMSTLTLCWRSSILSALSWVVCCIHSESVAYDRRCFLEHAGNTYSLLNKTIWEVLRTCVENEEAGCKHWVIWVVQSQAGKNVLLFFFLGSCDLETHSLLSTCAQSC